MGAANMKQKGKENVEKGMSFRKLACQPVGINSDSKTRHIQTEVPRPTEFLKEKMKTDDFFPW